MNKYQEAFEKVKDACVDFDTVDELIELKKLVEKTTPMKPKESNHAPYHTFCSVCGGLVFDTHNYCCKCGQALDWSEEE